MLLEYLSKVLSVSLSSSFEGEAGRGKFFSKGIAKTIKKQPPLNLPLRKGEKGMDSVAISCFSVENNYSTVSRRPEPSAILTDSRKTSFGGSPRQIRLTCEAENRREGSALNRFSRF